MTPEQIQILELKAINTSLSQQVVDLLSKVSELEAELSLYRVKKDSTNSSVPPSQDPHRVRRTESLRKPSGRKPGGQPGHIGSCLEMSANPDHVVLHTPGFCTCCGMDLSDLEVELIGKRQVIDIPMVKPIVTEHQVYAKRCGCGQLVESDYPADAHSPVCYGANTQALTAYLHARQYVPFERMREMYRDVFSLSISSGSLVGLVKSFADKSRFVYDEILNRVSMSSVVGADETGCRINGKNCWAWVFQTPKTTYIHVDKSRGKKAIDTVFPDGLPKAILVHDCWSSYFNVETRGHQICTAHLLRELKYIDKIYPEQQWSCDFTTLLERALELEKTENCSDYVEQRSALEEQIDGLLGLSVDVKHKKLVAFKERIAKYRNHLLPFLYHHDVPPDNNASERAIRNFKVKQKVSGLFRAECGAKSFATIRSVIDTTIKNGKNVWEALALIPVTSIRDG